MPSEPSLLLSAAMNRSESAVLHEPMWTEDAVGARESFIQSVSLSIFPMVRCNTPIELLLVLVLDSDSRCCAFGVDWTRQYCSARQLSHLTTSGAAEDVDRGMPRDPCSLPSKSTIRWRTAKSRRKEHAADGSTQRRSSLDGPLTRGTDGIIISLRKTTEWGGARQK